MSSTGQIVGGVVGAVVGFFAGGNVVVGAQIGMMIGGAIDPPDGPTINGPRLDDLSVQTATYGAFIPRNYGTIAQTGNIFWVKGDALTETPRADESGGKGGPTSTTNLWDYSATFALGLCDCSDGVPVDGVRRIWINGQLFYDAGSDDVSTIIASNESSGFFTLYHGTDTQMPDPLMQADKGAANVPAYRGLAYIVFDDLPLAKYNNSLAGAQIKVEIVKDASFSDSILSYEEFDVLPGNVWHTTYGSSGNPHDNYGFANYLAATYDPPNEAIWIRTIGDSVVSTPLAGITGGVFGLSNAFNNLQYVTTDSSVRYVYFGRDGWYSTYDCGAAYDAQGIAEDGDYVFLIKRRKVDDRKFLVLLHANQQITVDVYELGIVDLATFENISIAAYGDTAVISYTLGTSPYYVNVLIYDLPSGFNGYGNPVFTDSYSVPISVWIDFTSASGSATTVDGNTLVIVARVDLTNSYILRVDLVNKTLIGESHIINSPQPLVTTPENAGISTGGDGLIYWGQRVMSLGVAFSRIIFSLDKIAGATVPLSAIVQAECLTSSLLTAGDLDVTELTDAVRGYRISSLGALRGGIDPLRAAWPFDVLQHGYKLLFKRRGSSSVATITEDELDARAAGDNPGVRITNSREMDTLLPSSLHLKYLDVVREYDTNEQPSYKGDGSGHVVTVDIPVVLNADEASQAVAALHDLYWLERFDLSFVLPPTYSQLEPADVVTIPASYATFELRLTSTNTLPDGRIECRAKYNNAALYVQVAAGEEGQSVGATLTLAGPCIYQPLDIPLMRDDDDTAGFPVAMSGYLSGWPGGVLYRSDDSGETWADIKAFSPGQVIGYATTSLSAHGGTLLDKASTLSVRLYSGTLASVTEAQMFSGQNWFAYGADGRWEIIAAQNAVLQGDGSYILTDFMRGQRGTEWATGLHAANDRIVKLNATTLEFVSVNTSTIGAPRSYRAITTGKGIDSDSSLSFTYNGVNLECLSPVNLTGDRHPSTNDWTITATRRSRYDQWRDYVDAPLGEDSESYELDIFSDGTYTTLKRTIAASTLSFPYPSADQVTDFGSNQSTLYLKVYQLSATVGRGYPLTTSITRT
jgi:hypothetical protein